MNSIAFIILLLISMYSSVYLTKYLKEKNKINNFSSELIVVRWGYYFNFVSVIHFYFHIFEMRIMLYLY